MTTSARHAVASALALLTFVAVACTSKDDAGFSPEERQRFLAASVHAPREFLFTRASRNERLTVRGFVADDHRYAAEVSTAEGTAFEEVVLDDARLVKLHDVAKVAPSAAADPTLVTAPRGAWLADAAGAPPEFRRSNAVRRAIDGELVLEVVRALELPTYDSLFVTRINGAMPYDPDSSAYVERNDKFPPHPESGRRFDVFPVPYDPEAIFRDGAPGDLAQRLPLYFLYASFWFDGSHLTRVELLFDIDTQRVEADLKAAADAQRKRLGGVSVKAPPPVPAPFSATFTFRYPDVAPVIEAPAPQATISLPVIPAEPGGEER